MVNVRFLVTLGLTLLVGQGTALAVTASISSTTKVTCPGGANGAATATGVGGSPPYMYSWAPFGGTGATISGVPAGSYTVTVTDLDMGTATAIATITEPSAFSLGGSTTNVACNGGNNGSTTVTVSGATPGYAYSWAPSGGTNATAIGLSAGNYTVTVTDANSCQTTKTYSVTQPPAITLTPAAQTNIACNGGATGAATINPASGGTGSFTYDWAPGTPTGDGTTTVSSLSAGVYTVTATDANSCTKTQTFNITQPTAIAVTPNSQTNVACNGGTTGAAAINTPTGGAGGYTYNWTPGNPTGDGTVSVTGLSAGTWTATVTDANNCQATQTFAITQPTAIAIGGATTNVSCNGGNNGATTATPTGGTPSFTYSWAPSGGTAATASSLTAGNYTVTVTDANNCQATRSYSVTQPTAITFTKAAQTNVACFGTSTGAASVNAATGGTGGFTYDWAPGTPTGDGTTSVSALSAQGYTVTATDANSCTATQSFSITQPASALTASPVSQTNIACNGGTTGAATVSGSGGTPGYTYQWSPGGATTASVTGLGAGTYTATITDANSCTATQTYSLTQPTPLLAAPVSQTNIACNGGSNGAAGVIAMGGTPGYTYNWTPGNPTGDGSPAVTGLTAGTWTATITDANGCTQAQTYSVTQPTALVASTTSKSDAVCNGDTNGAISIDVTGGTPTYSYNWTPGDPTGDGTGSVTGLGAGAYTATITDANGCALVQTYSITEPSPLVANIATQTNVACNGGSSGAATVAATGGTGSYTYDWSGSPTGDGTTTATGLTAGSYTVTVADSASCSTAQTVAITEPTPLLANGSSTGVSAVGICDGSASVAPSGGTGPYTVAWTPGGATTNTQTNLCAITTNAVVTDANACTASFSATLSAPNADLAITIAGPSTTVNASASAAYTITASTDANAPTPIVSGSVPTSMKFVSLDAPSGWNCTTPAVGANGAWSCTNTSLAASTPTVFTLTASVIDLFGHGTIDVAANIEAAVNDATSGNNTATTTTNVLSPATLTARKTVAFTAPSTLTYTIVITNTGPSAALDEVSTDELTDTLPSELQLVSATATRGTASTNGNGFAWNGTLLKNESTTITVETTIVAPPAAGTPISNQATVNYDKDGNGTPETSEGSSPDDNGIAPTLFVLPIEDMASTADLATTGQDMSVVSPDLAGVDLAGADLVTHDLASTDIKPEFTFTVGGGGFSCSAGDDLGATSALALLLVGAMLAARRLRLRRA